MTRIRPRRSSRRITIVVRALSLVSLTVVWASAIGCSRSTARPSAAMHAAAVPAPSESEVRDLDIEFYRGRVDRDPSGAADLARLASLYLQRSRDTGDPRDAIRAEACARRSVRNRGSHNEQAEQVLSSSLLAQHRFDEALRVARDLRDRNPESTPLRAAVAEIEMELGQYDSARVTFAALADARDNLSVAPRLARWAEIEGRPDDARRLMRHAMAIAKRAPWLPREQLAWFWLRSGDIELRAGRLTAADSAYRAGLAAHPHDYRVLAALSHLAAVQGRWADAITYGDEAVGSNLDPATLGILSEAYAATGDSARSAEFAHALDVAVLAQPGAYHRAWSLFLLDHGRHLARVHRKIEAELRTRHDVYGYDLLAWSLHKQGRDTQARRAMATALSEGTQDAQLYYHAGIIERATGHDDSARDYLSRAAALNPGLR